MCSSVLESASITCVLGVVTLLLSITHEANGHDCPERAAIIPLERECKKSCFEDRDCLSRKKTCLCDGICGLSCIKNNLQCPQLAALTHGRVDVLKNNNFGALATYSCNDGYRLRGTRVRVCQGDAKWSDEAPVCVHDTGDTNRVIPGCRNAPWVPYATHGGRSDTGFYPVGTMLQYECKAQYNAGPDAVTKAWCVQTNDWVGPNMTCSVVSCPALNDIEYGWVSQDPVSTIGSRATYHCRRGYFLAGREERTCSEGGQWGGIPPSCETVTCFKPPDVDHALHNADPRQEKFPTGYQIVYSCSEGFYQQGESRAMCNGEGDWVGLTISCSPRSCGLPGKIVNGDRDGYDFTYPNTVTYYCEEGFRMTGTAVRKCQIDGSWSNSVPTCEAVKCQLLSAPINGRKYGNANTYGSVARFECDSRYSMIGSPERRCQADMTWSGYDTKCEIIDCGWPTPFYNGYLIGSTTTVGSKVYYNCNTRTTFEGEAFETTCLEEGVWSHPPAKCWGQCQVPSIPNAQLVKKSHRKMDYVDHRTTVDYTCKGGLIPKGGTTMTCDNGTWTNKLECGPAPCPDYPPHVLNGLRIFVSREHGFRAKYMCFPGYRLVGMETTFLRCNFGKWEPDNVHPYCEEFYCPSPGAIENGHIFKKVLNKRFPFKEYITTIRHGDKLEYECDSGFRLIGASGATCVDGQWQPPLKSECKTAVHPPFRSLWQPVPNV